MSTPHLVISGIVAYAGLIGVILAFCKGADLEPPTPPERDGESVRWAP